MYDGKNDHGQLHLNNLNRLFLLAGLLLVCMMGCSRNNSQTKTSAAPQADTTGAAVSPRRSGTNVNLAFLDQQIKRGEQVRQEINQLRQARPRDDARIRELVVKRKGEVLNGKKMVRDSDQMTQEQKDLMLSKLDEEAIELAQELVAVSQ